MSLVERGLTIYREQGPILFIIKATKFLFNNSPIIGKPKNKGYPQSYETLNKLSDQELFGIIRHEAHRIEKAVYNEILEEKDSKYNLKRKRVQKATQILVERGYSADDSTLSWAIQLAEMEENKAEYIRNNRNSPSEKDLSELDKYIDFVSDRRSTRVWSEEQPNKDVLIEIAHKMVNAAKWAPNSGNRQAWRFFIITEDSEKQPLSVIKEKHTLSAPLLIFVGMDSRLYGDVADSETGIYIDAGAATMQMVLAAHSAGIGTCWNHFGRDLITSRKRNKEAYSEFTEFNNIPEYIEPIAIVAVGMPEFIPPTPPRECSEQLLL